MTCSISRWNSHQRLRSFLRQLPILLILVVLLTGCAQLGLRALPPVAETPKPVRFTYDDPGARKVCVAGSFNQWSTETHCMLRSGDTWSLQVELQPGHYEYLFFVNDRVWKHDPTAALLEKSGFGDKTGNSVLIVE
jgi:1,4-alpha-glucan branching enzyme